MAKTINPIRKRKLKRELKKGTDVKEALLKAGYKASTADRSSANKSVKVCRAEIKKEFDASKITVEYILEEFEKTKQLCLETNDKTNLIRCLENLGRHLAMFTDKKEVNQTISQADMMKTVLEQRQTGRIPANYFKDED